MDYSPPYQASKNLGRTKKPQYPPKVQIKQVSSYNIHQDGELLLPVEIMGESVHPLLSYGHLRSATKYDLMHVKKPDRFLVE